MGLRTKVPTAHELAGGDSDLEAAIDRSRSLLHRRALLAAAAGTVPLPGLDWAVDAALLSRLIPQINEQFGLTPAQIDRLTPHKREQVQKAVSMVGSVLIGKLVTRELVMRATRMIGVRLTARQAAKLVPLAGAACARLHRGGAAGTAGASTGPQAGCPVPRRGLRSFWPESPDLPAQARQKP